ncbi:MAG: FKBP-type peptidyl-prolyl cis-trans isomerase [Chitinophagales bacterium]|nr:FKBP-type peptidyl-prolyl cis-trans isomerase [Chitinophagales bacterium]
MNSFKPTFFLYFAIFLLVVASNSCKQEEYKKTPNDLQYRIIVDNKEGEAQPGQVMKYNVYWRTDSDSLFLSTKEQNTPIYSKVDKPKFKGDPLEILTMLGKGDSASCYLPADLVFRGSPPPFLHHGDFMKLDFHVLDVMSEEEYNQLMNLKSADQLSIEQQTIESYLSKNSLKGEKTPSGLYVIVEDLGKGKQPMPGNTVKVNYSGMLLDGTKFDSSLDPGREPFEFKIGAGQVIKGWDEGIPHFKEGGKGKLIVPSGLAYGDRGAGEKIPPHAPLVFDIQLLEVTE